MVNCRYSGQKHVSWQSRNSRKPSGQTTMRCGRGCDYVCGERRDFRVEAASMQRGAIIKKDDALMVPGIKKNWLFIFCFKIDKNNTWEKHRSSLTCPTSHPLLFWPSPNHALRQKCASFNHPSTLHSLLSITTHLFLLDDANKWNQLQWFSC